MPLEIASQLQSLAQPLPIQAVDHLDLDFIANVEEDILSLSIFSCPKLFPHFVVPLKEQSAKESQLSIGHGSIETAS